MAVPVALENLGGGVFALEIEKVRELRIAGLDLLAGGVLVVGREVAAAVPDADVDQAPERVRGMADSFRRVRDVQVEDDAGVGLLRPREEALAVLLDEADRAVDDF